MRLFGAHWCKPCMVAKKWLKDHNLTYEYVDIEKNIEEAELYGVMTIPTLINGETMLVGFQAQEWANKLL